MKNQITTVKAVKRRVIRIHSWGGLGSQIFACLVARRLMSKFPTRNIIIFFHSGGVTSREIEVNEKLTSQFETRFVDDFRTSTQGQSIQKDETFSFRKLVTRFLEYSGLLARLNTEEAFDSITSRLVDVRGHYSELHLTMEEIVWISTSLGLLSPQYTAIDSNSISLHLRLGDLLLLSSKTHIGIERIVNVICNLKDCNSLAIYSDSEPRTVVSMFEGHVLHLPFDTFQISTVQAMGNCLQESIFIGSNSKISIWIAVIRLSLGLGQMTFLPTEVASQARKLLSSLDPIQELIEY